MKFLLLLGLVLDSRYLDLNSASFYYSLSPFVLPELDHTLPVWDQDRIDAENLYKIIEEEVLPMYYDKPKDWQDVVFKAMDDVIPAFTSARMADEYYKKLYK